MQFETELIRAIEHGCPKCGNDALTAKLEQRSWYAVWIENGELMRDWLDYVTNNNPVYHAVVCDNLINCNAILWTSGDGWIPELQEIVKGE